MKVTLINGETIELKAISLARRDLTRRVNQSLALASKLEDVEEAFGPEFEKIEDEYLAIATEVMEEMDIDPAVVSEADVPNILVYFRTGKWNGDQDLGKGKAGPQESKA